jgi:predicted PurR-regulated permease PerM
MFVFIVILFTTGLITEVAEAVVDEETIIPSYILFIMSFLTAMHVISGIFFVLLAAFHIGRNWNALKNHLKKNGKMGKEGVLAIVLTLIAVILAYVTAFIREL